jgi:hypothetical protein
VLLVEEVKYDVVANRSVATCDGDSLHDAKVVFEVMTAQ